MRYLHTMVRIQNVAASMRFYCDLMGFQQIRHYDNEAGRFTLYFLAAPDDINNAQDKQSPALELTYNWDSNETYTDGRNFGHLAFEVNNIYEKCSFLQENGIVINRPPRDGRMAFVKSPDNISIELLQKGDALPPKEPWLSMENIGAW